MLPVLLRDFRAAAPARLLLTTAAKSSEVQTRRNLGTVFFEFGAKPPDLFPCREVARRTDGCPRLRLRPRPSRISAISESTLSSMDFFATCEIQKSQRLEGGRIAHHQVCTSRPRLTPSSRPFYLPRRSQGTPREQPVHLCRRIGDAQFRCGLRRRAAIPIIFLP